MCLTQLINSPMHGRAISRLLASCSGELDSTESYLNEASATCTRPNIYDDLHALSSHNRLLAHGVVT